MKELTVGQLEALLRKYDSTTPLYVRCNSCKCSSSGVDVLRLEDNTNGTFGYVELVLETKPGYKPIEKSDDEEFTGKFTFEL